MRARPAALALCLLAPSAAGSLPEPDGAKEDSALHRPLLGGAHWRLRTPEGAVHVFRPPGFRTAGAGTVIYLHGYFTDVDLAWDLHRIPEQFLDAGCNTLLVAAQSPAGNPDPVRWRDPAALLELVQARTGVTIPRGPMVAVGHSGAYRTIVPWLSWPRLDQVVLLDGSYGNLADFAAWTGAPGAARRLILVGFETVERAAQWVAGLEGAVVRDAIPHSFADFTRRERTARTLLLRSQYGHMELVTEGRVLPLAIRLTGLPPL